MKRSMTPSLGPRTIGKIAECKKSYLYYTILSLGDGIVSGCNFLLGISYKFPDKYFHEHIPN
jgi:hypothetical protein